MRSCVSHGEKLIFYVEKDGFPSGHGFMQAPAAALLLTQLLLDRTAEIDIEPFAFTRFAKGSLVKERNVI